MANILQLFSTELGDPRTVDELEQCRAMAEEEAESGGRGCKARADAMYKEQSMRPCSIPVCFMISYYVI